MSTGLLKKVLIFVFAFAVSVGVGGGSALAQETTTSATENTVAAQEDQAKPAPPQISARAWALVDEQSGKYLAGKDASRELPMASTTKIMVALVTLEEADLNEEVTVSDRAAFFAQQIYSNVGLFPGDRLSVRELLMATLISSGDDAVYALAQHLGDGSADRFVEKMNREAKDLGLKDTHFENPSGLDNKGHYTSARDLAKMTRIAMKYPVFREMVSTQYATISTQDREIPLTNTNSLLATYAPATGVKTGTTPAAGSSLVASAAAGNESYIAVFLDAQDRFGAAVQALEHGFDAYDRDKLVVRGKRYTEADVPFRRDEKIGLVAKKNVEGLVHGGSDVEREPRVMKDLPGSAKRGTKLGEIVVTVDGEKVGESPLVARKGYDEASIWERVWYTVGGVFE